MKIRDIIFGNLNKWLVLSVLFIGILAILRINVYLGFQFGVIASLAPLAVILLVIILNNPKWGFFLLFISNYYVSGLSRYVQALPPGITMDIFFILLISLIILNQFNPNSWVRFKNCMNPITMLALIWALYLIFEIFNTNNVSTLAWFTSVRGLGLYFILTAIVASVLMRRYDDLKKLILIWAILCLSAVFKAFMQRYIGFDYAESRWLAEGGRATHIIYSGIRYFSFFTDAANFGTGIAFSGVVFAIIAFFINSKKLRVFYFFTALACFYGMLLSGTRGSIAVPFVGLSLFIILSKNLKFAVPTAAFVIVAIVFLKFTYIGHSNQYVRRMRSVFNTEDASFVLRLENQAKLKVYMVDKPFGAGVGMSRGKVYTYRPNPFLSQIATDSWYVLIWVETGIVGLLLHIAILLIVLGYGCYLVLFRLKDRELRGIIAAFSCGIAGLYVASYSLEIIGQFPTGIIMYTLMTFIFLSPMYEKEIEERKQLTK